jgi:hypothetical protein
MQDFFNKYEGKQVDIDQFPKGKPYQCTDWAQVFAREYYGFQTSAFLNKQNGYPGGGAADAFYNFGAEGNFISPNDVDLIVNDPKDPNQVPNQGDFIIFDRNAENGFAGHIAIFDVLVSHNSFYSYDQNAPKPSVQRVFHSFTGSNGFSPVIGWLTPKNNQDTIMYNQVKTEAEKMWNGGLPYNQAQTYINQTWVKVVENLRKDLEKKSTVENEKETKEQNELMGASPEQLPKAIEKGLKSEFHRIRVLATRFQELENEKHD